MMPKFDRLLIANRGEIACRIIATAQRMGLRTIAVYSSADRHARHVRLADEAYWIGDASPSQSYLNIDAILDAAVQSKAGAIHPGYGFLAENSVFADRVNEAGLIFIGPLASTIEQMGSKAQAKALMVDAGVPTLPGYHGEDQTDEILVAQAQRIGFPLMIKAQSGGGGKGMRVVHAADDFMSALKTARREGLNAFGDDAVILERYLPRPRHIEAQILGDHSGRIIHLYERDCSSQRRHQKIIEEAPSTGLSKDLRSALLNAATQAGQAVHYVGAGTVEFLVDQDTNAFYFLEMNTRLQVEHPVTEAITGLDLVEWQIRIAWGESLPEQSSIPMPSGHALEARIYAEDPDQAFLPSTGRILSLHWPSGVRIDSGVDSSDEVSMHYDPMIAKLVVWDEDRFSALNHLQKALGECYLEGPTTNLAFLQALASHPVMIENTMETGFLDRSLASVYPADPEDSITQDQITAMALAWWVQHQRSLNQESEPGNPWASVDGWRLGLSSQPMRLRVRAQGQTESSIWVAKLLSEYVSVGQSEDDCEEIRCQLKKSLASTAMLRSERVDMTLNDQPARECTAHLSYTGRLEFCMGQNRQTLWVEPKYTDDAFFDDTDTQIRSPMPGKVVSISCQVGDHVKAQDSLLVVEAMKMELSMACPISGIVEAIHVSEGDRVEANKVLIDINPSELN